MKKACQIPEVRKKGRWIDKEEEDRLFDAEKKNIENLVFKILYTFLFFLFILTILIIAKKGWLAPKVDINNTITNPAGDINVNTPEVKPEVTVNLNNTVNIPSKMEIEIKNSTS